MCSGKEAGRALGASAGGTDRLTARPCRRCRALDSEEPSPAHRGPAAPGAEPAAHTAPRRTGREAPRSRAHAAPRPGEGKPTDQPTSPGVKEHGSESPLLPVEVLLKNRVFYNNAPQHLSL